MPDHSVTNISFASRLRLAVVIFSLMVGTVASAQAPKIPEVLKPWQDWVTWGVKNRDCPKLYSNADEAICAWPSALQLTVDDDGGSFELEIKRFEETWLPLPGSLTIWPSDVRLDGEPVVVVQHHGEPSVKLPKGQGKLSGEFQWAGMPQRIKIPAAIGIVSLSINGSNVDNPTWDGNGEIWLRRSRSEPTDKDQLTIKVYRKIEDGIPLWLRTQIELTVSGKSREELLGGVLPEGWQLATVQSPIPVAIDDQGLIKSQVRAGKWTINVDAFRTHDVDEIRFATGAQPLTETELVGLQNDPDFRVSQIEGLPMVDVTQTTYPSEWQGIAVYQWDVSKPFQLLEKMRGMGEKARSGLNINRRLWLDEDGQMLTYHDQLSGQMQQIWRLDVAEDHQLGAVRVGGDAQLITVNPVTGTSGTEIRRRNLNMEAVGRVPMSDAVSATGWQADAESLEMTITTPPGWRVFAVFGTDQVRGDWLTAWSLLDLFLLLVFSLAVFKLFGFFGGIVALLAFGLSYHEPGSPRITWLLLLMPIALLRVVGDGKIKQWITVWKYVALAVLLLCVVPFIARQVQNVIYPQLEPQGISYGSRGLFVWSGIGAQPDAGRFATVETDSYQIDAPSSSLGKRRGGESAAKQIGKAIDQYTNLNYDPQVVIQTGPAQPQWNWNNVVCRWNGPVAADQNIRPVLISLTMNRVITCIRVLLLMALGMILLRQRGQRWPWSRVASRTTATAAAMGLMLFAVPAVAQDAAASRENTDNASTESTHHDIDVLNVPSPEMLNTLRERLLERSDAFPNAAEISAAELSINGNDLTMKVSIHAAADVAVPLPGRLPAWSPISVTMDGDAPVTRRDGYLWIAVEKGIHEVTVKGRVADAAEWEWSFLLKPRRVTIDAVGWDITGVDRNGVPATQVFFLKEQEVSEDEAAYDRTDFNPVMMVERRLEIGLIWKVRTTVKRLSSPGKAISIQVPLLEGEQVLTSAREVKEDSVVVQMAANQQSFVWESELERRPEVVLSAAETDRWVERWQLVTSPIWNVSLSGLSPIFEPDERALIPVWQPWPSETVTILFSRPVAVDGDTVTVQRVNLATTLGDRRRTSTLDVDLECSLANDFAITLPADIEITSLELDQRAIPVQRIGNDLIVPARPGRQKVEVQWSRSEAMATTVNSPDVSLPVEASNVTTKLDVPENRWILWADGPLRGPAVRFWTILAVAVIVALVLGSIPMTPLRRYEWVLLSIGLTQVPLIAAMFVVGWLFVLAYRGRHPVVAPYRWNDYFVQSVIVLLTLIALLVLFIIVGEGLLGNPDMFIAGNNSWRSSLIWFTPHSGMQLPVTIVVSISVWFYRFFMLVWALWLAAALLRWLAWGWKQFSKVSEEEPVLDATVVEPDAEA
ncbi:putative membrane protein [Rhodopirellula maiorica SM1]|uniref:Putative membrane protein n=1 Tax=Rhodopirellula maiorica SM1 TaxID=1265738 RepID=M5S9J1_9BACT|nr:hypothetical protein [Rhodopirellula maiorica]EMI22839.1 putative membrane protein [Rhodopirellula maiorica SM1]